MKAVPKTAAGPGGTAKQSQRKKQQQRVPALAVRKNFKFLNKLGRQKLLRDPSTTQSSVS